MGKDDVKQTGRWTIDGTTALIILSLFVLVIVNFALRFMGITSSNLTPVNLIILGMFTISFTVLWMIYLRIKRRYNLLRFITLAVIVLIIVGMLLIPFSSLPLYVSIYPMIYGTVVVLLYYYLMQGLRKEETQTQV